jgi:CHAD domain-containing protein
MTKPGRIKWDERAPAAANARAHLPRLVADYFAAVRELLSGDPAPPKLHQLRLALKRVRYTLELFRQCYGPGLEERLEALRELQQVLGKVNDATTARSLLAKAMNAKSPQSQRVQKFLVERATHNAQEFRKHWDEVFDAPGRLEWWTGYLARHTRAIGRRA